MLTISLCSASFNFKKVNNPSCNKAMQHSVCAELRRLLLAFLADLPPLKVAETLAAEPVCLQTSSQSTRLNTFCSVSVVNTALRDVSFVQQEEILHQVRSLHQAKL